MKKSIRPVAALLCLVFLASLLTSGRKNPSDTQSFQAVAKELGYNVYDITDQYTNAEVIRTATVAAEVWIRPALSVWGTRWTRWVPDSNLKRL